jgi:hypothetical protein
MWKLLRGNRTAAYNAYMTRSPELQAAQNKNDDQAELIYDQINIT